MGLFTSDRKGQMGGVDNLVPLALAIVSLTLVAGIGTLILSNMELTAGHESTVTDERQNLTGALPTNYNLAANSDANNLACDDLDVTLQNGAGTTNTTLSSGDDYNLSKRDCLVWIKNTSTTFSNYDDPGSVTWNTYTNITDTDAAGIFNTSIGAMTDLADFFTILVVIGIAAVIFLLLRVVRRSGVAASS